MNLSQREAGKSLGWRFDATLESEFQHKYYQRIRPLQRVISLLLGLMFVLYAGRDFSDTHSWALALQQDGAPALFFLLVGASTWLRGFERWWQPAIFAGSILVAAISLHEMAAFLGMGPARSNEAGPFRGDVLFFGQQIRVLMLCFALLRLQFKWMVALQLSLTVIGIWAFGFYLLDSLPSLPEVGRFLQPTIAIIIVVLLSAFVEEQLARRAFLAAHELEIERNDERRKREQTEKTLHVLSQAIGGIVHDLGNPLTTVQIGASTLDTFIDADADKDTLKEFTGIIGSGAQMLNYLRLSLIEQTRVLEGRPTPVDVKLIPLKPLLEAGKRFQQSYVLASREVIIEVKPTQICADEMKMITVFMNLIGNALKYSDGDVRIIARTFKASERDEELLIAVLDRGTKNFGITQNQAALLFTAFGRLDTHAQIEGTGLGLLSVQKIVEAHGGEVFIEGFADGTPDSPHFSTAQNSYPRMLDDELSDFYRTAFVIACPTARNK